MPVYALVVLCDLAPRQTRSTCVPVLKRPKCVLASASCKAEDVVCQTMSEDKKEPASADHTASASGAGPADETQAKAPPAPAFPPADAAKKAEETAQKADAEAGSKAVTSRQYLEGSVVPLLMQGMQELAKERPEDPVQYLAAYLVKHNSKNSS